MNEITPSNGALMSFIERAAKDETFDVSKFETLLRVRRDEAHDHARRVFNAAMAACQSEMEPVLRESVNPGVRSKYAKLEAIDQQMRPIYTRHGFSVRFGSAPPPQPGWMRITCTVAHESGYFEENYLDSPVTTQGSQGGRIAMTPVQAVGSVVTYLRRYLLGMVFNIVQADVVGVDDDGESQRPFDQPANTQSRQRAAATTTTRADRVQDMSTTYDTADDPGGDGTVCLKCQGTGRYMNTDKPCFACNGTGNTAKKPIVTGKDTAPSPERTREAWVMWINGLIQACDKQTSREGIEAIAARSSVEKALADAPPWAKDEIDAIIGDFMAKLPALPPADDLDEVVIEGQEKLAAG